MKKLMNNLKGKTENLDVKKITKVSSAGVLALLLLGGGSTFAYKMYDNAQDTKERQAQTTLIQNQAKAENVSLKSEDEIKNGVAQVIGTDASAITFEEIFLSDGISGKSGKGKDKGNRDFNSRNEVTRSIESTTTTSNDQSNTSTQVSTLPKYVYNVKATVNSMDYRFSVDATSGKVISSKVRN